MPQTTTVTVRAAARKPAGWLVGVGASAGGLEALEHFVGRLRPGADAAVVVAQRQGDDSTGALVELLARRTSWTVEPAVEGAIPLAGHVYVSPTQRSVSFRDGTFALGGRNGEGPFAFPVDRFFDAVARAWGDRSVAVVLSGSGADGSRGIWAVKEAGGLVAVEDPAFARFAGMPRHAIGTGLADLVAPAGSLAEAVLRTVGRDAEAAATLPSADEEPFAEIVRHLRAATGVDFASYRSEPLLRRTARRMAVLGVESLADYAASLGGRPGELELLYRELLIGTTTVFRDPEVFDALREHVVVPLVANATDREPLRVWVPACSTGEEAYSVAMLFLDELDRQGRTGVELKVLATDIDRTALERASRARYPRHLLDDLPDVRYRRFVRDLGADVEMERSLRGVVLFAEHDVTRDAPFTQLDLVSCRNLLIYLEPHLQTQVLGALQRGLRTGGALLLGASEGPATPVEGLTPLDARRRLYRRTDLVAVDRAGRPPGGLRPTVAQRPVVPDPSRPAGAATDAGTILALRYAPAAVVVDGGCRVVGSIGERDQLPWPWLAQPGLDVRTVLPRSLANRVTEEVASTLRDGRSATSGEVDLAGGSWTLRLLPTGDRGAVVIVFEPGPSGSSGRPGAGPVGPTALAEELARERALGAALADRLAAVNDALHAANEELLASNRELEGVNQELRLVDAEHRAKIVALEELHADIDHLLEATDAGMLQLDAELRIRRFSSTAPAVLGLGIDHVGRPIREALSGAHTAAFLDTIDAVAAGLSVGECWLDTAHGPMVVRIVAAGPERGGGIVVVFLHVEVAKRHHELARRAIDAVPARMAFVGADGTIRLTNSSWERFGAQAGGDPARTGAGANYFEACANEPSAAPVVEGIRAVLAGELERYQFAYPYDGPDGTSWFLLQCLPAGFGEAVVLHIDVSERVRAEQRLHELAATDPLTGVLNRRGLEQQLEGELDRFRRTGVPLATLMIDCDDFKQVNDRLGHGAGDAVLATVAGRLRDALRPEDVVARVGGDEFVALLPGANEAEAAQVAERLRLAVAARPVASTIVEIRTTVSVAIAVADPEVRSLEDLMARARFALRHSKVKGKNRVSNASAAGSVTPAGSGITRDLIELLHNEQALTVVGQPVVRLADRSVVGVELLSRSALPSGLEPATFFQVAVEEGVLTLLDERCLRRCLRAAAELPAELDVHVNVYPSTLLKIRPGDFERLASEVAGRRTCLELSEQQILGDPGYLLPRVRQLRGLGLSIAIDDIGFGRTCLESLVILEPEIVKIDRAYVRGVGSDPHRLAWLRRLVRVAQSLESGLVAEGVEYPEDATVLAELGVDLVQGYLFGAPGPLDRFVQEPAGIRAIAARAARSPDTARGNPA
ncbi:MAG: diguanylate cyclase [Acidimicrobiales bacterium]